MNASKDPSQDPIARLKNVLIVSSQASEGEPLCAPEHICALALSGINGGARGLRLEGAANIEYVRKRTDLPIVGLIKSKNVSEEDKLSKVYITASFEDAKLCADAGSDIVALDATPRQRLDNLSLEETISRIHNELKVPVWADISSFDEGLKARAAGADVVSTTLFGYTAQTSRDAEAPPDFDLLERLCAELDCPIVLEGRVWHPEEVSRAFELGAHAVVVGSAITRPQLITKRFVAAIPANGTSGRSDAQSRKTNSQNAKSDTSKIG